MSPRSPTLCRRLCGSRCTHSHFDLLQAETFARQDDTDTHAFAGRHQTPASGTAEDALVDDGDRQMFYGVETCRPVPSGRPARVSLPGAARRSDHGVIRADLTPELLAGDDADLVDWRTHLRENRDAAMEALTWLT